MIRAGILLTVALCLIAAISILQITITQNEMQAETQATGGSFTVTKVTPTPTPSPTPEPSTTPTQTPIPTSTPLVLTIDNLGQQTQWLRDEEGKLLEDIVASSADSKITLIIYGETFVLDAAGEPLTHIYISWVDPFVKAPPSDNSFIYIYELSPGGATFSQPIEIIIHYNPLDLPKSPDQLTLKMYSFDSVLDEWSEIPCVVDTDEITVSLSINHLSIYALSAEQLPDSTAVPQTTPKPAITAISLQHNNWLPLILIWFEASLMFFIYVLLRRRRDNRAPEDAS